MKRTGEMMSLDEYEYGVCGVFCEMCPTGNGRIVELSKELLHLTDGSYGWAEDLVDFSFTDLRKGLDWLSQQDCPTCKNIERPWCEVRKCERLADVGHCLVCDDFLTCQRTEYQRDRYPSVLEHYRRVQEIGLEGHLKEERERARKGISLIDIRKY